MKYGRYCKFVPAQKTPLPPAKAQKTALNRHKKEARELPLTLDRWNTLLGVIRRAEGLIIQNSDVIKGLSDRSLDKANIV